VKTFLNESYFSFSSGEMIMFKLFCASRENYRKRELSLNSLIYVARDLNEIVHCQNSIPAIMQSAVDTTKKRPKLITWRKKLNIFPLNFTWTFVLVELLMLLWWDLPGQLQPKVLLNETPQNVYVCICMQYTYFK